MNANAANALLKSLEEPPVRTIFLLVSHAAGRLLPTIRSRCRALPMRPLAAGDLAAALDALDFTEGRGDRAAAIAASGGSVRRAILLIESGSAAIVGDLTALLEAGAGAGADRQRVFALADKLTGAKTAGLLFDTALDVTEDWLAARLRAGVAAGRDAAALERIAGVWERLAETRRETEIYNLDRKELLLDLFESVRRARLPAGGS
jgi:DNA polymerase-3 subunit delta'